jgi:hypothetical protein
MTTPARSVSAPAREAPTRRSCPVEVAAYYAVSEAVANAAKHARAGGTLHITSPPGVGTTLLIQIPAGNQDHPRPPGP